LNELEALILWNCHKPTSLKDLWKKVLNAEHDVSYTWLRQVADKLHLLDVMIKRKTGRNVYYTTKEKEDVKEAEKRLRG